MPTSPFEALLNAALDASTGAFKITDYAHVEIHQGDHFFISGNVTLDTDAAYRVKFVTPDTAKRIHFRWDVSSSGICALTFDEGASGGMTGGSSIEAFNSDRDSQTAAGIVVTGGVIAANSYTKRLENLKWGAGGNKLQASGGGSAREDEIKLSRNKTYLGTLTSGADGNIIQFRAFWYEHTDS